MPGIVGYIKPKKMDVRASIQRACAAMRYADWYVSDPIFEDEKVAIGRTHLGILGEKTSPFQTGNIYIWLEGEAYNLVAFSSEYATNIQSLPQLIAIAYQRGNLPQLLAKLDGYFVGTIYDSAAAKVYLFTDQLGIKPLYFWQNGQQIGWASELKTLLALPKFDIAIDSRAIDAMLDLGTMPSALTWFKNVELLTSSTLLEIDLTTQNVKRDYYWRWADWQQQAISFAEAKEQLIELLQEAVQKRLHGEKSISVALSGGIDSRVLLANSYQHRPIEAFTFGKENSLDVQIAREVARKTGISYQFLELERENWLKGRFWSIWKTDGMMPLNHLHYSVLQPKIKKLGDIVLNGFAGDLVVGGSYLSKKAQPTNADWLAKELGKYAELYEPQHLKFLENAPSDAFWLDYRVRRFTTNGSNDLGKLVESRKPFMDKKLLQFLYCLPDNYRSYYRLYSAALAEMNMPIFNEIPWQQTGIPITKKWQTRQLLRFKIPQIKNRLGWNTNFSYVDYPAWLSSTKSQIIFQDLLSPKNAIFPNFVIADWNKTYYQNFLQKRQDIDRVFRAATIEVWLRWLFDKEAFLDFQNEHDLL